MMAVLDEVQFTDPVHVDRGHRLAAATRRRNPFPTTPHSLRGGSELPVEFPVVTRDGADDRVKANVLEAEIALPSPAQRRRNLLEGQHRRDVVRLEAKAGDDPRERDTASLASEVGLGVLLW
jgi:hypothetical protein